MDQAFDACEWDEVYKQEVSELEDVEAGTEGVESGFWIWVHIREEQRDWQ